MKDMTKVNEQTRQDIKDIEKEVKESKELNKEIKKCKETIRKKILNGSLQQDRMITYMVLVITIILYVIYMLSSKTSILDNMLKDNKENGIHSIYLAFGIAFIALIIKAMDSINLYFNEKYFLKNDTLAKEIIDTTAECKKYGIMDTYSFGFMESVPRIYFELDTEKEYNIDWKSLIKNKYDNIVAEYSELDNLQDRVKKVSKEFNDSVYNGSAFRNNARLNGELAELISLINNTFNNSIIIIKTCKENSDLESFQYIKSKKDLENFIK